ncbi:MAG TPA: PIN domain-containing protein [Candidatus Saccharimonadales bacterium]|nr:PIN domain-containing protein [Candidatus Saccharimonadales bacterium]
MPLKVFVDSDVIISSLISSTGAAFLLLNQTNDLNLFISNFSLKELRIVVKRLGLSESALDGLVKRHFSTVELKGSIDAIKSEFADYVLDINDAHIVTGAQEEKVHFLISYNTKHFKADKLKEKWNIILTTPANLLQYLRSV